MDFHKKTTLPDLQDKDAPLIAPKKIGSYKVQSLLNRGGMSYLFLATSQAGLPVAIKVLVPKFTKNKEIVARFLKEAKIIQLANHPNIIKLYEEGTWEKGLYIAMEFIRGVSLRPFIQQKSLSQKRALDIVIQVAYALLHLHSHGIIHRDLKPENILINESGEVKVIDFGIAQFLDELPPSKRQLMGTPSYMSPEQKIHPEQVGIASDLYSLAVICYELLTGDLAKPTFHFSLLPKPLQPILEKSLQEDPKNRYTDMIDFITELSEAMQHLEAQKSDDLVFLAKQTQMILSKTKVPSWGDIEVGFSYQKGASFLNGIYLDFLQKKEDKIALLIEPTKENALIPLTFFAGIFRTYLLKTSLSLPSLFEEMSALVFNEFPNLSFRISLLYLFASKEEFAFIGCDMPPLLHMLDGEKAPRELFTPNPLVGAKPNSSFLETVGNLNAKDLLVLSSHFIKPTFTQRISPQSLCEKLVEHKEKNREGAVIALQLH